MQNEKAEIKMSTPEKLGLFARLVWRENIWMVVSLKKAIKHLMLRNKPSSTIVGDTSQITRAAFAGAATSRLTQEKPPRSDDRSGLFGETVIQSRFYLPTRPLSTPTPVQKSHPVVALWVPQLPEVMSVKYELKPRLL